MKRLLKLIIISLIFISCEKYEQPTTLTLSGTYTISKVVAKDNNDNLTIFLPSDTFINNVGNINDTIWRPLNRRDTIFVGETKWSFDYSKIYMKNVNNIWQKQYYYFTYWQTNYDYGYIEFNTENGMQVFKILDDGIESLTLQVSNEWNNGNTNYQILTLHLTRIGP